MPIETQYLYEFGPFRLDPAERRLLHQGKPVPLTPKAFQTLLVLVENQGRLMGKEELLRLVWPDTFVEESTLAQNVFTLRKQLGDDHTDALYIETVPKRGYRFAAPVRFVEPAPRTAAIEPPVAPSPPGATATRSPSREFLWVAAALAIVLLFAAGAYLSSVRTGQSSPHRAMLIVLPVRNLTGDSKWDVLSDGMTEEMISQLGSLNPSELGVLARTTSMVYKTANKTVAQIAQELGVDYVLESSLRQNRDLMRVTVQLIRARDQTHIFAQDYDRNMSDLLRLQSEIAEDTARSVRLTVPDATRMKLASANPVNPDAYEAYLQGRFYWNQRTRDGLMKSLEYYNRAVKIQPNNARAYAGIADSENMLAFYGYSQGRDTLNRGRVAALKALELDDSLPEAHAAMAYGNFMWWWEWPDAERDFLRAIQLNANYVPAHHWYALFLAAMGRQNESLNQIRLAQELDPRSLIVRTAKGFIEYFARQDDAAIDDCRAILAADPNFAVAHYVSGLAFEAKKDYPRAIQEFQQAVDSSGRIGSYLAALGHAEALSGNRRAAQAILDELNARAQQQYIGPSAQATVYAGLGETAQAVEWMQRAGKANDAALVWMDVDPRWDSLHSDPWYRSELKDHFVRKEGLPAK